MNPERKKWRLSAYYRTKKDRDGLLPLQRFLCETKDLITREEKKSISYDSLAHRLNEWAEAENREGFTAINDALELTAQAFGKTMPWVVGYLNYRVAQNAQRYQLDRPVMTGRMISSALRGVEKKRRK